MILQYLYKSPTAIFIVILQIAALSSTINASSTTTTSKTTNGNLSSIYGTMPIDDECYYKICAKNYRKEFCQIDFKIIDKLQSNQFDSNCVTIFIDDEFTYVDSTHEMIKLLTNTSEKAFILHRLSDIDNANIDIGGEGNLNNDGKMFAK